ncbi:MAG: inositol-3-phosphate synthase [Desulfosalsimonas sp.]|uniref:inositol-3-phosphate synthase n=1 Tax=Desulfosalsimonas sp. TaxID=3073848 RepID=UPI003970E86A
MTNTDRPQKGVLLLAAGIKGAIGSTVAASAAIMQNQPETVLPYLTTGEKFRVLGEARQMAVAGWDTDSASFDRALDRCGVLEKSLWEPCIPELNKIDVRPAPDAGKGVKEQVAQVKADMAAFQNQHPGLVPVFVNLLPAGVCHDLHGFSTLEQLYETGVPVPADIVYAAAAVESGIAAVNFTPNDLEIPALVSAAAAAGVPLAGKDGKTGQTYFKVVLASSLLARRLHVNGWYSLNILGNADGENLMDPQHAACKLDNKTGVLEEVLGYAPGEKRHNRSAHKVHIDYYPPRGDAKEAWDVIDFEGIFGMPMSMRINLQGRDSILAAPMVMDLARWMAALTLAGRSGPVPELAFFFKKPVGQDGPVGFEKQMAALEKLEKEICL